MLAVRVTAQTVGERLRTVSRGASPTSLLAWGLPILVFGAVRVLSDGRIQALVGLGLALGAFVLVWRFPTRAFLFLLVALPLQHFTLALLYHLGMPAPLVRGLAGYRDIIVVGLLVFALRRGRADRTPLDRLDKLALAYVALVTAYLVVPNLFVPPANPFFPGAPTDLQVRLLSYRGNVGFVLLLIAARHLPHSPGLSRRVAKVVLAVGLVLASGVLFEFFFSSAWNNFAVNTVGVTRYEQEVLNTFARDPRDVRVYVHVGGKQLDRPGSIFFDPLQAGFYLLLPLGVAISLASRRALSYAYVALPLLSLALLLTYVRSAVLAAVVMTLFSLRQKSGARVRLTLVVATGAILLVFVAIGSGFTGRLGGGNGDAANSNTQHAQGLARGYSVLVQRPLGVGLGSEPGIGDRFVTGSKVVTEDAYLQVGTTLGIPAMALFISMLVIILRRLKQAQLTLVDDPLASAYRPIGMGLAAGALFLHIWNGLPMAMTFWGGAGLLFAMVERESTSNALPALRPADRH